MSSLPPTFSTILHTKYLAALNSGHLTYTGKSALEEVVSRKINDSTYDFHLTELESLEARPQQGNVKNNPFEKSEPELTIVDTYGKDEEFRIILNKFPVVPAHFMLVTKDFKSQNTPLSPNELLATYAILTQLSKNEKSAEWFAFYNCGLASGASQPHKHVQFMSLPSSHQSFAEKLISSSDHFIPSQTREPLSDSNLPFAHFVAKLPPKACERVDDVLLMTFYSLLQRVLNVFKDNDCQDISYNFCATTRYMMLVPRSKSSFGDIGINSCGFMGLVLCKNAIVTNVLKQEGFENVLGAVGFANISDSTNDEYQY